MTALLAASSAIPVAFAREPMGGDVWRDVREEGQSLAEIVASVPALPAWFEDFGIVCVDGTPVPRGYWSRRPGENTCRLVPKTTAPRPIWVTLHVRPHGGEEGGAKNIISIVASVALIAVGAFITGGGLAIAGGPLAGLFGAGSTSAAILAAGVTTLGRLAITLLSPPAGRDKARDNAAPVLGSAGAQGNALSPGGAIPRVAGRLKIFPPFASLPLVELTGDDETVEASYILAGPHKIEDLRVEGAKVEDIANVQFVVNEGLSSSVNSILNRYGVQRSPNYELSQHRLDDDVVYRLRTQSNPDADLPTERIEVSATDPDEIWIQLTWPTGLTNTANPTSLVMPLRLRMRILGTSTWINLPEMHFASNKTGSISKKIVLKWGAPPSPLVDQAEVYGAWESFHTVPVQSGVAPIGLGGWTAHSSFVASATPFDAVARVERAYDGFTIYLDEAVFPRGNRWEVGMRRGHVFSRGQFNPAVYGYVSGSPGTQPLSFFDYIDPGAPRIYFNQVDTIADRVVLSRFASVKNAAPLPVAGNASIEIRARNVQLAQLSCIASAYVPDWDGTEWTGSVTSSNPAVHLAHIMTGGLTEDPVQMRQVRNSELVAFRQHCIDESYEVALSIDGQNWFEAMQAVASCGFGRVRAGTRWGVAFDRDTSAELGQHFSPRNASNFVLEKAFSALEDAFRVSFRNRAIDWEQDERLVIRPGLARADVRRIAAVNAVGLDTAAAIDRRFGYDLRAQEVRDYTLSFDVPPEGLVSQMGDVVSVSHPVLNRHHRAARIAEVLTNGSGLITGLILDNTHAEGDAAAVGSVTDAGAVQDFGFQGLPLAASIICSDLSEITRDIVQTPGDTNRVIFATPFASSVVQRQNMVVIGEAEEVTERLVIREVRPTRRFSMRITALPEAPELWS